MMIIVEFFCDGEKRVSKMRAGFVDQDELRIFAEHNKTKCSVDSHHNDNECGTQRFVQEKYAQIIFVWVEKKYFSS